MARYIDSKDGENMNKYRNAALMDALTFHASFMIQGYESKEALEEAIQDGSYTGDIHQELADKSSKLVATLRLKSGEAKVMFCENSTWVVWFQDILNRWYRENKDYFDKEVNSLIA